VDIESGEVSPRSESLVLVLDSHGPPGLGLSDACFRARAWMLVFSSAEITKGGIHLGAVPPRGRGSCWHCPRSSGRGGRSSSGAAGVDGVLVEPSPDRGVADGSHQAGAAHMEPSSARLQRESGSPSFAGNSHAMALTRTTSSGGENPGASGSWAVIQTPEALLEEALTPHADDFTSCRESVRDFIIREAIVSQENHLGAEYFKIRQRILVGSPRQLCHLVSGQQDCRRTCSWRFRFLRNCEEGTRAAEETPVQIR
jgi:hypothetical protein